MRRRHRRATVEGENAMKGFIFGILTVILILALGLAFVLMGFVSMRADNPPSKMETALAGRAMDASVARAAPKLANPVTADNTNLVAGARLNSDHCDQVRVVRCDGISQFGGSACDAGVHGRSEEHTSELQSPDH